MPKTYRINEIFYSIQGEGVRAGTANIFIRFSGCNLKCSKDDIHSGFDCDTEFASGVDLTLEHIARRLEKLDPDSNANAVIFTGGEPALQLDQEMIDYFKKEACVYTAIETNGTHVLPEGIDWVCVSPKSAEHTLRIDCKVDELKYVRNVHQGIPKPSLGASNYLISPAFEADGRVRFETLQHCVELVKANPKWRLSVQLHKFWRIR